MKELSNMSAGKKGKNKMKGIILAGGSGTRLYPATKSICKQLLPIYDKPMIYYPLSTLMLAGIKEILIISTPKDTIRFEELLGNGNHIGLNIQYKIQKNPNGLAEAFILGKDFIGKDSVALVLGDNLFFGHDLVKMLNKVSNQKSGATVFGYYVDNPTQYGVAEIDKYNNVISLEEKPKNPKSNYAVVGLYFYDNSVVAKAENLKPSSRGELEITDINKLYLEEMNLKMEIMGRGYAWLDTGTHKSLLEASQFVQVVETRQGLKIACIEEIAYRMGYITLNDLYEVAEKLKNSSYGKYLFNLAESEKKNAL